MQVEVCLQKCGCCIHSVGVNRGGKLSVLPVNLQSNPHPVVVTYG